MDFDGRASVADAEFDDPVRLVRPILPALFLFGFPLLEAGDLGVDALWPLVHRFTGHPWVGGTWRAIVTPAPESHIPAGGNRGPVITCLTIEQTYWTLHATLRTAESASRSDNATIVKTDGAGIAEVRFLYDNTSRTEYRQRSPATQGPAGSR
ncbi:hypothetical protein ABT150_46955 [Streptomyces mirabilis]|uniref:hypothetical protein n=1 Tax=Streptomyces mirabilis TaxID=68239 RepID=UPI003333650C